MVLCTDVCSLLAFDLGSLTRPLANIVCVSVVSDLWRCTQGLPGDSQLVSFHFHARHWFSRILSWSLIEDMYVRLGHELP